MSIRLSTAALSIAASVVFMSSGTAANTCSNMVPNGSFENGNVGTPRSTHGRGNNDVVDWEIMWGFIDYVNTYWPASDGSRSVSLNGEELAWIQSAPIPTQPGTQYTVLFDIAGNPEWGGPPSKWITVDASNAGGSTFTYDTLAEGNSLTNMKWRRDVALTFTATVTSTRLGFRAGPDTPTQSTGMALDNVRMYPSSCLGDGGSMGDPHFQTWGNQWFDFHGICDLVLAKAPKFHNELGLEVHIRTKPRYEYAYIEAAAIKLGEDILEVGSFGDYVVNGVRSARMPYTLGSGGYVVYHEAVDEKKHMFGIKDGATNQEVITIKTFKDMVSVNIVNTRPEDFADVSGMMGNREGLLVSRDGKTIFHDYDAFGQEWQVTKDDEELFETPSNYANECVPATTIKQSRRLGEATAVSEEAAGKACAHHVDKVKHDMCVLDVLAMADLDVAEEVHGAF